MSYKELIELITHLDKTGVAYVDYKTSSQHVVLSKEVPTLNRQDEETHKPAEEKAAPQEVVLPQSEPSQEVKQVEEVTETTETEDRLESEAVKSPMVGVVYLQPQPDADPYVKVGDRVEQGDVVCIVEAMKLMNEIQAPHGGIVKEIVVENEEVVEFNQPLVYIEP